MYQRTKFLAEAQPSQNTTPPGNEEKSQVVESPSKVYGTEEGVDIDKLAYAVAMQETHDCTKGYGAQYNNCFGLKNGSIVPCETGNSRMCIFGSKEEAYGAFKKVWLEGYGNRFPTKADAVAWSGNDRSDIWLNNVKKFYYQN